MGDVPVQVPGFELLEELGHGTSSVVYRARRGGSVYAVKMPLRNETGIKLKILSRRFRREAVALARLRHPLLPRVLEVGVVDRAPYIIMELAEGETLSQRISRHPLDEREVVELGRQLASVLSQVHENGLVHRDVKPKNIVFDHETGQIRLVDFGFAASIDAAFRILEPVGTLEYAAPEQVSDIRQRVDGRADLYALGCVLYECLTQSPPFPDLDPKRLLFQHGSHQIPDVREVAPGTSSTMALILKRLLARNPDHRYATAAALAYDLEHIDEIQSGALGPSRYGAKPPASSVPLVGRDKELSRLRRDWVDAEAGHSRIAVLRGGVGSGKTSLAHALMDFVFARGYKVLSARCHAWDPRPFSAIREIVEGNSQDLPSQDRERAGAELKSLAGDLAPLLKVLSPAIASMLKDVAPVPQSQDAQHIFIEGLAEFLRKLFREVGPAVVFVDDLQWLDASSRRVLRRALDRSEDSKTLYVFSARGVPGEIAEVDRFLEGLAFTQINVDKLFEKDVADLIGAYLGDPVVDAELVRSVTQLSDGTPLSTLEVLRMMLDEGHLLPSWGQWKFDVKAVAQMHLSESARGVLGVRIESLDDMTRSTITAAAIIGMTFEDRLLPLICGLEEGHTTAALAEARRAMLVEPARMGMHRFVHDSVREALLKNMSPEASRELHQRAAEAMDGSAIRPESVTRSSSPPPVRPASLSDAEGARPISVLVGGDVDADACYSLASHYARGIPGRTPSRVYDTNVVAGRLAFNSFDNERALGFFETAAEASARLRLPADPALNLLVGEAKLRIGALESSRERFTAVLEMTTDPLNQALALSRIAWIHQLQLDSAHAWEALEKAFVKLGKRAPTDSLWAAVTSWSKWIWSRLTRKAVVAESERQTLEAICSLYYQSARLASLDEKPLRIVEAALSGAVPAERLGPSTSLARIYVTLSFVFTALGIRKAGRKYLRLAEDVARSTADPVAIAHALQIHTAVAAWDGNLRDSIETGNRCLEEYGHWRELSEYCLIAYNQQAILEMCGRNIEAWHAMEAIIDAVEHHEGDPFLLGVLEIGARAALTVIGREQEAEWRLRKVRKLTVRVPDNSGFLSWTYVPQLRLFTERADFGPGFEELVNKVASKKFNPKRVHLGLTQYYIHLAHARIHAILRAAPSERKALVDKLDSARQDLRRAARIPVIRAHSFVVDAYYEMFVGRPAKAERLFAKAESLGREENAPWVLYAVYRGRAHMLRARGREDAARDQARLAASLAAGYGMAYRLQWVREEFALSRETDREVPEEWPPSATRSISELLKESSSSGHLRSLLRLTKAEPDELDPANQARAILDDLVQSLRAENGLLFVPVDGPLKSSAPAEGRVALLAGRNFMGEDVSQADQPTRELVQEAVVDYGAAGGAAASYLLSSTSSRAMVAVPLTVDEVLVGVAFLDRGIDRGAFTESDGELLVALAGQVPIALELARVLGAKRRSEDELQRAQRLESMERMARGVARDFGRVLADIRESADVVMSANVNGARDEVLAIQSATWRAGELTKRLLAFSDGDSETGEPLNVNDRIRRSMNLLGQLLGPNVALTIRPASDLDLIKADSAQIDQMLVTLALRAREAMPKGGTVVVETSNAILDTSDLASHAPAKAGRYVRVTISDTGHALESAQRQQIFDPFASEDGAGAGLALATLYRNVKRNGGFIDVESIAAEGTTFRIYWPTTTDRAPSKSLADGIPMLPRGSETILLVEHEPLTTDALGRVLKGLGYRVLVAQDGVQALKLASQRYVEIDLVISDASLPGMSGPELGRELVNMRKALRVLYLSDPPEGSKSDAPGEDFLHKPVQQDVLARRVREALDRRVAS